jgi:hypothetical protein
MIKHYFSTKERLKQKNYRSDIYKPYGCRKPSFIKKISQLKSHLSISKSVLGLVVC